MSESLLTLEEILQKTAEQGLDLTERTFRYYAVLGLLPRPVKRPSGSEDARVHYYPPDVVARLLEIRDLQVQGYTLKQIKAFHQAAPTRGPQAKRSSPDAATLLHFFAGEGSREAGRRFLRAAGADDGDEAVRVAALQYYRDMLVGLLGEAQGDAAMNATLSAMSPLEVDALIQPLRRWRDAERHRAGGQYALVRALRVMARRGRRPSRADVDSLKRYVEKLDEITRKLHGMPSPPVALARAREAVEQGLEGLSRGARMLQVGEDGASAEIDRAGERLEAAAALLVALRKLVGPDA